MRYLVFQLYAPMASWGEAATGEIRRSARHPSRSAILGLLGAALGIRRDEDYALAELRDGVAVAIKQLSPGVAVQDYHTAQVPGQDRKARRLTRRDELAVKDKLHTILSTREYRCDGFWRVAIRAIETSRWSLDELAEALQNPRFPLYFGRKSCPPAAPLAPRIVEAEGLRAALSQEFPQLTRLPPGEEHRRLGLGEEVAYAWEGESGDLPVQETRYPYDQPLHRGRWQFASRPEHWHQTREES